MSTAPKQARVAVFLLILVLAVGSRFWGLGWGLPHTYHVDENWFSGKAMKFLGGNLNPEFFHVPTLHMYALAGMWGVYYQVEKASGNARSIDDFTETFIQAPTVFYLIGRTLSALMGIGTILLLFLLGQRMFGFRTGAIAALLLVFGLDHARISHDMLPDVPMVFFLVLGYLFIWNIAEKGRTRDYLWAGAAAGLAMTTKYGGIMLFLPLFIAHLYRVRLDKRPWRESVLSPRLIGAGLIFLAVFVLGSPYVILDFPTFKNDFLWQSSHLASEGHFGDPAGESAVLFYLRHGFRENVGAVAQFFVFGGVILALFRRRKAELILLSYPLLQFAMISMWKTRATRYLFPMAPFFILIAAFFMDWLLRRGSGLFAPARAGRVRKIAWQGAAILLTGAVIAPSAVSLWKLDSALAGLDSRTRAKQWIDYNLPAGTCIALDQYGPPISRVRYSVLTERALSDLDLEFLAHSGADYAVTSDTMAGRFLSHPEEFPKEAAFYASLEREGNLVKIIEPGFKESQQELHMPELRIFRLSRAPAPGFPVNFRSYVQILTIQRTDAGWDVRTAVSAEGGLGVGERPENLYLKISDSGERELTRIILKSGPLPVDGAWTAEGSAGVEEIPEGAVVDLGYEYILAPNPIAYPLDRPLRKEYRLPGRFTLAAEEAGGWSAGLWFTAVPGPGGDHFQTVTLVPGKEGPVLRARVFGPSLRYGDCRISNPRVLVRDASGNDLQMLLVFSGRLGASETDTPGPVEAEMSLSGLPPGFRLILSLDGSSSRTEPNAPAVPVRLALPPLPEFIHEPSPNVL
ncbi:MAG: glycosyltransferase family 39 protein [Candidatus Aminicenantes bacterium]|nr:glycosyltransferase family 39 protein [Candidatus Aminicenantes bacterium]